jgi:hypothetical protein
MRRQWRQTMVTSAGMALLLWSARDSAAQSVQEFPLRDTTGVVSPKAKVEAVEYLGRRAVKLTMTPEQSGLAWLTGVDFQDGVIEADLAVKVLTPPGVRMPGFLGIAFRAKPDGSKYELFYIRPRNARAADQAMRNHAVQYSYDPDFWWFPLRRAWPAVYEAYTDIDEQAWTHLKIEVAGRTAKLYVNNAAEPTLVVDGLKGEDLRGGVGLSGFASQEAYFSNVRITHATPQPLKNGTDAAGAWEVTMATDAAGPQKGVLTLARAGKDVTGSFSGSLGDNRPVKGSWRDGYVELSFPGALAQNPPGAPSEFTVTLAGWFDGDAGKGRMKLQDRAEGVWTATAKKQPSSQP